MSRTILLLALVFACGGCAAVIVPPPRALGDAPHVPVMVADYGYHSTVILPKSDGGLVEYAYGDWNYFGHNNKSVSTALHALLASDQATLGRRILDRLPNQPGLEQATGAKTVIRFDAPRDKVAELERALEHRFSVNLDSIMYSPAHGLYFVKDDEPYGVGHNCNHFTAEWLERLGCRVEGLVITSKFRLKESDDAKAPATTAPSDPTTRPASTPLPV